ncbi:MAG: ABC transporter ATP-binding protein [Treponema sp.]|jgi:ABC-type nitrate/sulfonate/bicarbonate transport system ATPase subunit|nr:ABC transporter ATP-binding protein [Treponema sp.]
MGECIGDLRIHHLSRTFRNGSTEVAAVKNLSMQIPRGSFTVVVGISGCGKTTLLKLIAGLEKPDTGAITFAGSAQQETGTKPRFGFVFQDPRLLPWLTVEANLRLAFPAKPATPLATEIDQVLRLVGLDGWKKAYPRQLSGGMAQRVALARALCRKPHLLFLDEPFGALDTFTRSRLRVDLEELWKSLGITILLVTHDIEEAVYLADRVIQMKAGTIAEELPIPLPRPRNYRSREFQDLCFLIQSGVKPPL